MIAILQMKSIKLLRVEKGDAMNSIEIKHLTKTFGDIKAVDDLSFTVEKGTFFSFLGVNGAGKSTTISMMCGELSNDAGEIYIEGKNIKTHMNEIRNSIGVVYQTSALDDVLTVYDNLRYRGALYGITGDALKSRIHDLSTLLDFRDYLKKPLNKLSGGQKRRVAIAGILAMEPDILVLDEPTAGLDPQGAKEMLELFKKFQESGKTVIMVSHDMNHVLKYCDHVVVMNHGEVERYCDVDELFSERDYLESMSIDLPVITDFIQELNMGGFHINPSIKDIDELVNAIGGEYNG